MAPNHDNPTRKFGGFPPGELHFIAIPEVFFGELLPAIDNLPELKVTLHILWLRQKQKKQAVYETELSADESLLRSLTATDDEPQTALKEGLRQAVERGSLLRLELPGHGNLYVLNSENGRRLQEQLLSGEAQISAPAVHEIPAETTPGRIFQLYEANIGLVSPILAEELKEAEEAYPHVWIEEAFKLAVENNVRRWSYIRAILQRWAVDGKDDGINKKSRKDDRQWYTDEEYDQFIQR
jgi:DNA replication protein